MAPLSIPTKLPIRVRPARDAQRQQGISKSNRYNPTNAQKGRAQAHRTQITYPRFKPTTFTEYNELFKALCGPIVVIGTWPRLGDITSEASSDPGFAVIAHRGPRNKIRYKKTDTSVSEVLNSDPLKIDGLEISVDDFLENGRFLESLGPANLQTYAANADLLENAENRLYDMSAEPVRRWFQRYCPSLLSRCDLELQQNRIKFIDELGSAIAGPEEQVGCYIRRDSSQQIKNVYSAPYCGYLYYFVSEPGDEEEEIPMGAFWNQSARFINFDRLPGKKKKDVIKSFYDRAFSRLPWVLEAYGVTDQVSLSCEDV